MESTMPAKATASAVKRAGPLIFVSFSFRLRFESALLEIFRWPRAEVSETRWKNCTPASRPDEPLPDGLAANGKMGPFSRPTLLAASQNSWRHQPDAVHTGRVADVDRFRDLRKTQFIVPLHEQHALGAIGVDRSQPGRQFL